MKKKISPESLYGDGDFWLLKPEIPKIIALSREIFFGDETEGSSPGES